jgi:hypothetical protein
MALVPKIVCNNSGHASGVARQSNTAEYSRALRLGYHGAATLIGDDLILTGALNMRAEQHGAL